MLRAIWAFSFLAAVLLVLLIPAYARSYHHHHARHHVRPTTAPEAPSFWSRFNGTDVLSAARAEVGNGPIYGRRNLWCARFMNWVLERTGHHGTNSDLAMSFASLPQTSMHVGAIAVMGHHVGIVSGVTARGDPVLISGNHGSRVREAVYPARRVVKFVEAR